MTIAARPYAGEADYDRLRRFLHDQADIRTEGAILTVGDLDWWRFSHEQRDKMRDVYLWLDEYGGRLIAWAWTEEGDIDLFIHPDDRQLLPEMVAWAEQKAQSGGARHVTIVANDRDETRRTVLGRAGFHPTDAHYSYRRHSLDGALPTPVLPEGFSFRDMRGAGDDDIERRVNVHRAAWEPSKMTVVKHRLVMASPTYRPDLDLVVVAANGDFAACTIVWYDDVNQIGVFEPVGCAPEYRQRRLTQALMYEGMRRLARIGAHMAFVNSWHASLPANRLYESCGFELVDHQRKWTKPLA